MTTGPARSAPARVSRAQDVLLSDETFEFVGPHPLGKGTLASAEESIGDASNKLSFYSTLLPLVSRLF